LTLLKLLFTLRVHRCHIWKHGARALETLA